MSDDISEALLEMHFHSELMNYFSQRYKKKVIKLYKPSARREVWLGFDQAWVCTKYPITEFISHLQDNITSGKGSVKMFIGYFLQFKRMEIINNSRKTTPILFSPYYRTKLSMKANKRTGISQHETLLRISSIPRTRVYYSCPMIFNYDEVYTPPDLSKLRFVDILSAPSGFNTSGTHYIAFQRIDDYNPYWFSEPIEGKCIDIEKWASNNIGITILSENEIISYIQEISQHINKLIFSTKLDQYPMEENYLPESWTIIELGE